MWHAGSLSVGRPAIFSRSPWIKLGKIVQVSNCKQQSHPFGADSFVICLAPCKTSDGHLHFFSEICQFSDFPKCSWNKLQLPSPYTPQKKHTKKSPETLSRSQLSLFFFPVVPIAITDTNGHQLLSSPSVGLFTHGPSNLHFSLGPPAALPA